MPLDMHTLCRYRMARAEEDLLTAEKNHQSGFYNSSYSEDVFREKRKGTWKLEAG